jgi:hypothetical protein
MQPTLRIDAELDAKIRARVAELYLQAPTVAFPEGPLTGWEPASDSPAARAQGILLPSFIGTIEGSDGGVDLALSVAHGFLREAASQIATVSMLTLAPPPIRWGTIGPIARPAAERGATVRWLLSAPTDSQRLAWALLIELRDGDNHLKWLGEDASLEHWMPELVAVAADVLGVTVETDNRGRTISVAGERMPALTELIRGASSLGDPDDQSYAELSIFTHPTGLLARAFNTGGHYVEHRQLMFEPDASLHAEARLMEDCTVAFAQATLLAHTYLGHEERAKTALIEWMQAITSAWIEWCTANGCTGTEGSSSVSPT